MALLSALLVVPGQAQLVSSINAFQAGKPFTIAIRLTMDEGYHGYWLNPGDSGLAPVVNWKLPKGWKASAPEFPVPERIAWAGTTVFGYEHPTLLLVELTPPHGARSLLLTADLSWMVCKDDCVPVDSALKLYLRAAKKPELNRTWATRIRNQLAERPTRLASPASAIFKVDEIHLAIGSRGLPAGGVIDFFPRTTGVADPKEPVAVERAEEQTTLKLKLPPYSSKRPVRLSGLLKWSGDGGTKGYWIDVPISSE